MSKKLTKEDFIAKAIAVHGNKYSYDKVAYTNSHTPVDITCPIHGDFPILPNNHTNFKCGCPKCTREAKTDSKEEFIAKAKAVHGDKYNYDKVMYVNNKTTVTITCSIHGDFPMTPKSHKAGQGCPECAMEIHIEKLKEQAKLQACSKEEFIAKAKAVHGDKYNYDKVMYVNNKTTVTITCPIHGDFPQTPNNHTSQKQGCPYCAIERRKETLTDTLEEFIAKARAVHGDKYDYDNVMYINDYTPVFITCQKHGDFPQTPHAHKSGNGCPKCKQSHLEEQTRILLEQNSIKYDSQKKFPWLKSNKKYPMFLDFYLPKYNIAIECQGEQHYEARGNIFTEEIVNEIKQRDKLKLSLCKEHGISVYYIKYKDNVEESINNLLVYLKSYNNDR